MQFLPSSHDHTHGVTHCVEGSLICGCQQCAWGSVLRDPHG